MGDDLIGVPQRRAASIIGVSERRLVRWRRVQLLVPGPAATVGARRYWTYSLQDLVQGRVIVQLEERGVDARMIGRLVTAVRSVAHPRPLASLRWATERGEVFVGFSDRTWLGGRVPNQYVATEVLDLEEIRAGVLEAIPRRPAGSAGRVVRQRGVMGSKPVFEGTRIPVGSVVAFLERCLPDEEIIAAYPDLTSDDIDEARRRLAS